MEVTMLPEGAAKWGAGYSDGRSGHDYRECMAAKPHAEEYHDGYNAGARDRKLIASASE